MRWRDEIPDDMAKMNECCLVTVDGRLRRGADRLGFVVTPAELSS